MLDATSTRCNKTQNNIRANSRLGGRHGKSLLQQCRKSLKGWVGTMASSRSAAAVKCSAVPSCLFCASRSTLEIKSRNTPRGSAFTIRESHATETRCSAHICAPWLRSRRGFKALEGGPPVMFRRGVRGGVRRNPGGPRWPGSRQGRQVRNRVPTINFIPTPFHASKTLHTTIFASWRHGMHGRVLCHLSSAM
jgi:hypothetical protein